MPRPVNRIPHGYLDFFGLKSLGKNPNVLLDDVRPTVDLREWYLRTNAQAVRFNQQLVAGSAYPASDPHIATGAQVVPAGEWWYVHSCTLIVFSMAAAVVQSPGVMSVRDSQPSQYYEGLITTDPAVLASGAAAAARSWAFHSQPRIWFPPLTSIGASYGFQDLSGMAPGDVVNFNVHLSITWVSA